jgi:hypothetical protein
VIIYFRVKNMLNPEQPMYFYDDRSKENYLARLSRIIHVDGIKMMAEIELYHPKTQKVLQKDVVMVNLENEEIESSNWQFWYATQDMDWVKELDERNIQRLEEAGE